MSTPENTPLLEALALLDPDNDEQWTSDGLPKVDAVAELYGLELKRADIAEAAPDFNRDAAKAAKQAEAEDGEKQDFEDPEAPPEKPKSLADRLFDELETLRTELTEVAQGISKLTERRRELELAINYVGGQYERAKGASDQQTTAVQDYLATQNRLRQEKAARVRAITESGVGEVLKTMGPSALDAAMRRRKPSPSSVRREYPASIKKD